MNPVKKFTKNYLARNLLFTFKSPEWSNGLDVNFYTG